jgi:hypothetical protein
VIVFLLAGLSVSLGSDKASLTVFNRTNLFLHVVIQGRSFLYIAPGGSAQYETDGPASITVKAFYAPGQGVNGSANRSFRIYPWKPESTGCSWETGSCVTSPASGGPQMWEVTADTLTA